MEDKKMPSSEKTPNTCTITASLISYYMTKSTIVFKPCTTTPPTYILRNVSLTANPSEILAVVGPSGAGKSTLLDILSTRTSPSTGNLFLNNSPLNPSTFRKLSAYVPQHDASLPLLTVSETFAFSASLLNPKTENIGTIVGSLLKELRLTHLAHTRLADGLSGGERRRVSIGLSLLHDPAVLILDEPTSGLDSTSAFNVVQTLRSIATSKQRTVILSIHQPSFKILSIIDRILLMCKGGVVHQGTLFSLEEFLLSKGFTLPPQLNSLEYAMELLNQLDSDSSDSASSDSDKLPILPSSSSSSSSLSSSSNPRSMRPRYKSSRFHEIRMLYSRFWKIIYRTKQLLLTNTLQALIVGLVLGTIYINIGYGKKGIEKRFGLFAFTLTFLLSSTTETLPIFLNERPILLRESSSGVYRLSSYLIANTLVFLPYLLAIAVVYSFSLYFLVGLCFSWKAFGFFTLVIWVIVLMANSFVMFLSSLAPNYIAGTSLVTILLGSFFLFSGYFISTHSLPKYWLFMHYLSMYKYALDALLINEYKCLSSMCLIWDDSQKKTCSMTGKDVLVNRGLHEREMWHNVYILVGFFVFYRVLCLIVLIRRISISKK